jgi:hypothetical protein
MRSLALSLFLAGAAAAPALAQQDPIQTGERSKELDLYSAASLSMHRAAYKDALRGFKRLLADYPQTAMAAEARYWEAKCLQELGQAKAAKAAYVNLERLHPRSGWTKDGRKQLHLLRALGATEGLGCNVQLKDGRTFIARLRGFDAKGATLEGGPYAQPTLVPIAEVKCVEVQGKSEPRVLFLRNGDRISGTLNKVGPSALVLESPSLVAPIEVPPTKILELRGQVAAARVTRYVTSITGVAPTSTGSGTDVYGLPLSGGPGVVGVVPITDRKTVTNPDGSRTTVTVREDGTTTTTTTVKDGEGRRIVIERAEPGENKRTRRVELKLDGSSVDDAILKRHLLKNLPEGVELDLGDVDLDLDFELDPKELKGLHESLKGLPKKLRERILHSLHNELKGSLGGKKGKLKGKRRAKIRVLHDHDETHPGHSGKTKNKRVMIFKGEGKGEKKIIVLEGDEGAGTWLEHEGDPRHGKRVEKRVIVRKVEGKPHRVWVQGPDGKRVRKKIIVRKHSEGEDETEVFLFGDPQGPKMDFTFGEGDFLRPLDEGIFGLRGRSKKGGYTLVEKQHYAPGHTGMVWQGASANKQDRVFLSNGDRLSGRVQSLDGSQVHLRTEWGQVAIRRSKVKMITFANKGARWNKTTRRKTPPKRAAHRGAFLGVSMASHDKGVKITHVIPKTAAERCGLRSGDVIVAIGRYPVRSIQEFSNMLRKHKAGDSLHMWLLRDGKKIGRRVVLGKRPSQSSRTLPAPSGRYRKLVEKYRTPMTHEQELKKHKLRLLKEQKKIEGKKLRLEKLHKAEQQRAEARERAARARERAERARERAEKARERAERKRAKERARKQSSRPRLGIGLEARDGGVFISSVLKGGAAGRMGLRKGDRITHFQGKKIGSYKQLVELVRATRPGQRISMRVLRGEDVLELVFRMGSSSVNSSEKAPAKKVEDAGAKTAPAVIEKKSEESRSSAPDDGARDF